MNNRQEPKRRNDHSRKLTNAQKSGMRSYNLSNQDVHAPNFEMHTLLSMEYLYSLGRALNYQEAFDLVRGLDFIQVQGVTIYELSQENVRTPNFGNHSLLAISFLRFVFGAHSNHAAFEIINGLDESQVTGIITHGLSPEEVRTRNFGAHTLLAINTLILKGWSANINLAFQLVVDLSEVQTRGISDYRLNRELVMAPGFSEAVLDVMEVLHQTNPDAEGSDLYNTAIDLLEEYQLRGVAEHQLTLEQVGIALVDGRFEQGEPLDPRFRANHVDVIGHLLETENIDCEEAYQSALNLNSTQITGMIDFGCRLDQVQQDYFSSDPEILGKLIEELFEEVGAEEWDLNIPLVQEQQERIRTIFDSWITSADINQGAANTQTVLQDSENKTRSELEETSGFASMPIPDDEQSAEGEEMLTRIRGLGNLQNFPLGGTDLYNGSSSDESLEDRKPAAKERKNHKNQSAYEGIMEQGGENSLEQNVIEFLRDSGGEDVLGLFDCVESCPSASKYTPETTTVLNVIDERATVLGGSLRVLSQSTLPRVSINSTTYREPNSRSKKKRKLSNM
jgi:hypothetical protein